MHIFSDASIKLELGSGILIGVPIPETSAASGDSVELAIQTALSETVYALYYPLCSLVLFVAMT